MLTQQQIAEFDRNGFQNGGRVLDDAELEELSIDLDRIIAKGPDGFAPGEPKPVLYRDLAMFGYEAKPGETASPTPVWQILNIWEASPAFEKLLYNPKVVAMISQLTRMKDLSVWHDQLQYKPAMAGGSTTWHQDAPLWPTIAPMTPVSAWIPLDDADIENGCMWMVPGSHTWGNQQGTYLHKQGHLKTLPEFSSIGEGFTVPADSQVRQVKAVPWPVKRGEVSFHHSLTWHGSPMNKSPRRRRAIAIHYMTGAATYVGKRGHPMEAFITLPEGAPMAQAGEHFPVVCRDGKPVGVPERLREESQKA